MSEVDVGLRPAVSDHQPVLGPTNSEGIFIAGGHYRGGVILAPATAHWMAELMTTGSVPRGDLSHSALDRLVARQQEAAG